MIITEEELKIFQDFMGFDKPKKKKKKKKTRKAVKNVRTKQNTKKK
tara:strand:+ start:397 stop:534 length:138 start_codon:yes stop_codon:yes gene_type:complete